MKKFFAFAAAFAVCMAASAQLSVGINYLNQSINSSSTLKGSSTEITSDPVKMNGTALFAAYDFAINDLLGVQAGIQFSYSFKTDESELLGTTTTIKSNTEYLSIPVYAKVGCNLTDDIRVFAFAGPEFNYALAGNTNKTIKTSLGSTSTDDDWFDQTGKTYHKKFNIGLGLGLGVDYQAYRLTFGYHPQLTNTMTFDENIYDSNKEKTNTLSVGIAYLF